MVLLSLCIEAPGLQRRSGPRYLGNPLDTMQDLQTLKPFGSAVCFPLNKNGRRETIYIVGIFISSKNLGLLSFQLLINC